MIKNIIFLLLISFNSFGQNYTLTQLIQVYKKDSSLKANQITTLNSQVKLLQDNNKVTQDRLFALEHDSIPLDSKFFAFINGKWTFVGVGNSQKWIDSVTGVLVKIPADIKQLYTNDVANAKATSDSSKAVRVSLSSTDKNIFDARTAMVQYNRLNNIRIDSVVTNEIDYGIPIQGVQDSVNETNKNVQSIQAWADKVKDYFKNIFINFPL